MSFSYLIEIYVGFPDIAYLAIYPKLVSCLAMQSHFYILRILIPFLSGGDFPPSVDILHMYPCIEHRYVPLLGTSLFSLMKLVSS